MSSSLRQQLLAFMDEHVYPNEKRYNAEIARDRWAVSPMIEELKPKARAAGLWNLFLPENLKKHGLRAAVRNHGSQHHGARGL